ncbi:hypothetical protein ACLGBK_07310 [Helicobacter pylori]
MKTILLFLSYCIALIFRHAILNANIFELLHCIDFQARNFERQPLVQLDPKEIKTQILERLKLQNKTPNKRKNKE